MFTLSTDIILDVLVCISLFKDLAPRCYDYHSQVKTFKKSVTKWRWHASRLAICWLVSCQLIRWWVMGERNHRCLQMTRRQGGVEVLGGEGGFSVDSAQLPVDSAQLHLYIFLLFLEHRSPSFLMEGKFERILCSNNHSSVTVSKGAFQPIYTILPEWDRHLCSIDKPS